MYGRWSAILFPVICLALVFSLQWGYKQNGQKDKMTIKAENQYQRAFHDLVYHVQQIKIQLGNGLAVDGKSNLYQRENLLAISRLTSDAQNEVNQLPLTMLPFQQTETFLNNMSKFTYGIAARDLNLQPLSVKEKANIATLYTYASKISEQLDHLRDIVINDNLKWTDAEFAYETDGQANSKTNPIMDGLNQLNQKVTQYKELEWGPTITGTVPQSTIKSNSQKSITQTQLKKIAMTSFQLTNPKTVSITKNGDGMNFKSFSVKMIDTDQRVILADFTKEDGRLLWFTKERPVGTKKISIERAIIEAKQALQEWKFPELEAITHDKYDGIVMITFAEKKNNVIHYPHRLTVKIALDNGEMLGVQASEFVNARHQVISTRPRLTLVQAKSHLQSTFRVKSSHLVTIMNKTNQEVLCYAFIGQMDHASYRIYINATTGMEEQIEQIKM